MNAPKPDEAAIFNAARSIDDPDTRRRYLEEVCGDDHPQRARLDALLRIHQGDPQFLEAPAEGIGPPDHRLDEVPGGWVGQYHLLKSIGEGGFGIVFLAEQERPVRRQVALKIIKPGMDTRQVVARFEAERQVLALMEHPNIAQILDGGETETGRPYFVMELVRGVPITAFCDEHRLPAHQRLTLFVSVCRAVQHAHHKGVIHRDLKPSNVLITQSDGMPRVKIIDFGVAKAIAPQPADATQFTAQGQMVGTPAYMSPEQASTGKLDVDTRSDVYSLGVLLYELLTGTTPIDLARLRDAGCVEVQRLIAETEPPRPSTRLSSLGDSATVVAGNRATDPRQLSRLLSGDLDWIVMKALEKDRDRRYASPGDFADDAKRYLRREAIVARPASATYRLRKAVTRNRGAVVSGLAVAVALLAGTVAATWQAIVAIRARQNAIASADAATGAKQVALAKEAEARAVVGFLEERILQAARPKGRDGGLGPNVTLRDAIDAAVPYVGKNFKNQPLIEARLRVVLGNSYWHLGDGKAAAAQLEPARAIYTKALGPDDRDTLNCTHLLGISYGMQGLAAQSVQLYEALVPRCKAKFGAESRETLMALNNLAMSLHALDRNEDATRIYRESLAIKRAKFGPDDRSTLVTMTNLANEYHTLHRYEDALALRQETYALFKRRYGADDSDALMVIHNIGANLRALGRYADALRSDEETLTRRKAVLGADHPDTLTSLWSVAEDLIRLDRGAEAVPRLDECLARGKGKRVHRNFADVADLRLRHFERAKNAAECRRTAEQWEKQQRSDPASLYQAAVCRAVTATLSIDARASSDDSGRPGDEDANRALEWLRKAIAAGYRNVSNIDTEHAFDLLRARPEFKELTAPLKSKPELPKK